MKKRFNSTLIPPFSPLTKWGRGGSNNRSRIRSRIIFRRYVFGFTFLLCLLGSLWVWKANMHSHLSQRLLILEGQQRELSAQGGILRADLSELSQFTRIEDQARRKLGMIPPHVPPDTVWCSQPDTPTVMGAAMFFGFKDRQP